MTSSSSSARAGHPYHMHDAIYAQPGALRLLGRGNAGALEAAATRLRGCHRLILAGVGSSWHAAQAAERLFATAGAFGHRARVHNAFELAYAWPLLDAETGLILVSHRATNRATHAALARAKIAGAPTVVVAGREAGPLDGAEYVLRTVPGEPSQAHTVSYTCAIALLALLASAIGNDEEIAHSIDAIPDQLARLLGQESWPEMAARFAGKRRYFIVGAGSDTATALEAALKISETGYLVASGFQCDEFLHGAWVAMEAADLLILVALPGPGYDRCLDAARAAREIGTPLLALVAEGDRRFDGLAAETIEIPEVHELLAPILTVVPIQLLTYHWALRRGANPDVMRANEPTYARAHAALIR
jgi:glutamine---fructose-6-phosphate transaminase (isomerizing)